MHGTRWAPISIKPRLRLAQVMHSSSFYETLGDTTAVHLRFKSDPEGIKMHFSKCKSFNHFEGFEGDGEKCLPLLHFTLNPLHALPPNGDLVIQKI